MNVLRNFFGCNMLVLVFVNVASGNDKRRHKTHPNSDIVDTDKTNSHVKTSINFPYDPQLIAKLSYGSIQNLVSFLDLYAQIEQLAIQTVYDASNKHMSDLKKNDMFYNTDFMIKRLLLINTTLINLYEHIYEQREIYNGLCKYKKRCELLNVTLKLARCCEPPKKKFWQ